ncbi:hypothetical protein AX774_g6378 [Zancudomyces culisetae]|uniref:Uncharacterized protein n=1 Tax=Zancudomyces culisetae TaxID=1213189 RepID=A0A1R1PGT6_ZANCU|nr:hypothetical protein AX774_g6378 [Zancudomyces culisetae]|eukprot:OMH80191.1 hypothetical protein AX774_g6378 [Zancudomyces culisetae]
MCQPLFFFTPTRRPEPVFSVGFLDSTHVYPFMFILPDFSCRWVSCKHSMVGFTLDGYTKLGTIDFLDFETDVNPLHLSEMKEGLPPSPHLGCCGRLDCCCLGPGVFRFRCLPPGRVVPLAGFAFGSVLVPVVV